jgi:BspA type Leucine rich repeat region (6 copies)
LLPLLLLTLPALVQAQRIGMSYWIPNGVVVIEEHAFAHCSLLTDVAIPGSVTTIGNDAFLGCSGLTAITVDASNSVYSSVAGVLFDKDQTTLIRCPAGDRSIPAIPGTVTSIGDQAFSGCFKLLSVTIPNGVTSIGNSAFAGCTSMIGVTIPDGVIIIGGSAFAGCTQLRSVTIPSSVTNIGNDAFLGMQPPDADKRGCEQSRL